jgi:dihydrolipoamide dehydrogenase
MIMGESAGTVKIITEEKTGELLGCHVMAPRATDMIGEIAAAMRAEGTIEELCDTIHAHPTVSEMIMEAAHDAQGHCIHQ